MAEEANQFHQYSQQVIQATAAAQRNVFPLYKAARGGIRGAPDPISRGARPIHLVQDLSDAEMPHYISGITQNTKKLNEAADIQAEKKRLGFSWWYLTACSTAVTYTCTTFKPAGCLKEHWSELAPIQWILKLNSDTVSWLVWNALHCGIRIYMFTTWGPVVAHRITTNLYLSLPLVATAPQCVIVSVINGAQVLKQW